MSNYRSSNYNTNIDSFQATVGEVRQFFTLYAKDINGVSISETDKIVPAASPYEVTLDHPILNTTDGGLSDNTPSISGFVATASPTPSSGEFYIVSRVSGTLRFNASDANTQIPVDYLTIGDRFKAAWANKVQDGIYAIEKTLGRQPQGGYATVAAYLAYLAGQMTTHSHDGGGSVQLTMASISDISIKNQHIHPIANIWQSKISSSIPSDTFVSTVSTLANNLSQIATEIKAMKGTASWLSTTPIDLTTVSNTLIGGGFSGYPDGLIDGANSVYTFQYDYVSGSINLWKNRDIMYRGGGYNVSSADYWQILPNKISMTIPPASGTVLYYHALKRY